MTSPFLLSYNNIHILYLFRKFLQIIIHLTDLYGAVGIYEQVAGFNIPMQYVCGM